jgi:hypothetical protein
MKVVTKIEHPWPTADHRSRNTALVPRFGVMSHKSDEQEEEKRVKARMESRYENRTPRENGPKAHHLNSSALRSKSQLPSTSDPEHDAAAAEPRFATEIATDLGRPVESSGSIHG